MIAANPKLFGYIPDGYTTEGYLAASPGLYPEVYFSYRPLQRLPRERIRHDLTGALARAGAVNKLQYIYAGLIKRQVIEWDLLKDATTTVPLEPEEILRLHPALFERIINVLMGVEACDLPPSDRPEPAIGGGDSDPAAMLDAIFNDETLEENLEGN